MKKISDAKGFTLIELLVVIAVIGILAAVVLASMSTSRGKGEDAAIKRDLVTIRTQANIYYVGPGVNAYGATAGPTPQSRCASGMFLATADPILASAIAQLQKLSTNVDCRATTQAFAVSASLKQAGANASYCVDATNAGKITTVVPAINTTTVTCN